MSTNLVIGPVMIPLATAIILIILHRRLLAQKNIRSLSAPYFSLDYLLVVVHRFEHLVRRLLLFRREVDPVIKQLFEFWADFHHFAFSKELCHCDAESITDRFQRCD